MALIKGEYEPSGHGVGEIEPTAQYEPAGHDAHTDELLAMGVAEKDPSSQGTAAVDPAKQ